MSGVFVYWDNSNVHHEAQRIAEERDGTPGARYLVRIHFDHLLRLAHADRPLTKAVAAGSVPPEMQQLWNRTESAGVEVSLFDRGSQDRGEQDIPDRWLQLRMLEDGWGLQRRRRRRRAPHRRWRGLRRGPWVPQHTETDASARLAH